MGRRTFEDILRQPWLGTEDNCLLLEENGRVLGYCLVTPELPIERVVLDLDVALQLEGGPQETEMVRKAVSRAQELGGQVAHVCVGNPLPVSKLLEEEGFSQVRTYWNMLCRRESLPDEETPEGFTVRSLQDGEVPILTAAQNAAFQGSWGYCPNTVEQVEYRSKMANTSPQGILLLSHGDKTAGYCWTCLSPAGESTRGIIGMIGVVPDYRGRGVSRTILLAGMKYLRALGVADIGLEVDGSNTPAIRLYTSVGFQKAGERHWFERGLSPATTPNC